MPVFNVVFWSLVVTLGTLYIGYYLLCLYLSEKKSLKIEKDPKFAPKISIIIPAWNEEKTIEGKIKNTLELNYPKTPEIIVIDDGTDDKTNEIARKFKGVKLITQKQRTGKAVALNRVFKLCKGDLVLITDADSRLEKDVLLKSVPYFSDKSVGAITGRQSIPNASETTTTKIEKNYRNFFYLIRQAESILDSTFIFDGPFMIIRRDLLEDIHGDSVADDSEIALRVRKKGYRTLSLKGVNYIEYASRKIKDRTKRKQRRAQGLIQIMTRFFGTFFLNPKYGWFGMFIFPVEFFMHVISPILILMVILTIPFLPLNLIGLISALILLILLIPKSRSIFLTFIHSQYACLKGMVGYFLKGPSNKWEQITDTRRYEEGV
ncbi:MAG: glycosyltransferase [Candidatus Aenigmarchaeota archaeon]|nr:glycosyltransferase [Candidatus Aenigmarchaeota archaeon]